MPELAEDYELTTKALLIDGRPFPWHIHEGGPLIEALEPGAPIHVLWIPVLVDKPAPQTGTPDGEPLVPDATPGS